jgi:phospholipid/cholesterol/gamma-HCH transport system substrate-binding protein
MSTSTRWHKTRRRLVGVVFLVVFALLAWLSVALYHKQFTPVAMVTLYTTSVGNEMHVGAEVMVRGVQVGEVRQITANGTGARMELAIQPGVIHELPANVTAEMLPTTLFGERFVDLIVPASPSPRPLANGSVISQDRSADALELEKVLNNLLPLLAATEPDKLSLTLTALGQGLQGRGKELGQTLVQLNSYLHHMNPRLPALDRDIKKLIGLSKTLNQASPNILQALADFSITSRTIATQSANVDALFTNLTTASDDLRAFLAANGSNMIHLSAASTATLSILATYAPEFPCTLSDLVKFEPAINKVLGQGTNQPGIHVHAVVVPSLGRYHPREDRPVYGDNLGPHCFPIPFPGIRLHDGTSAPLAAPARTTAPAKTAAPSKRQVTTRAAGDDPTESELIRELAALSLGERPGQVPGWGSLLLGPLFRGEHVKLTVSRT